MNQPRLRGVVAILRGVTPVEIGAVSQALRRGGIGVIEVPLNSPQPLLSIAQLARDHGRELLVGAGTVLQVDDVDRVADAGARLVLAPNLNPAVVRRCVALGLLVVPGVATPTEGFAALDAGASALKLFPAELLAPPVLKAWRAVFPAGTAMLPVGGVGEHNLAAYKAAGAVGVGVGSTLYGPGLGAVEIERRATRLVQTWDAASSAGGG